MALCPISLIQLICLYYASLKILNFNILYTYFLSPLGKIGPWCEEGG